MLGQAGWISLGITVTYLAFFAWGTTEAARAAGVPTRRTGTSVSLLRAEAAPPGVIPDEGLRRPAALEDVFVMLTGEEIE